MSLPHVKKSYKFQNLWTFPQKYGIITLYNYNGGFLMQFGICTKIENTERFADAGIDDTEIAASAPTNKSDESVRARMTL